MTSNPQFPRSRGWLHIGLTALFLAVALGCAGESIDPSATTSELKGGNGKGNADHDRDGAVDEDSDPGSDEDGDEDADEDGDEDADESTGEDADAGSDEGDEDVDE